MGCLRTSTRISCFFLSFAVAYAEANSPVTITATQISAAPPAMVIGFVGGFVKHDNAVHSTVQVVKHLRKQYSAGVYVEAFENRRREKAHQEIWRRLDRNHDGKLSAEEKRDARIIIFGHSWGASETVTLARSLERDGIPVLLTIQVDSVSKIGFLEPIDRHCLHRIKGQEHVDIDVGHHRLSGNSWMCREIL